MLPGSEHTWGLSTGTEDGTCGVKPGAGGLSSHPRPAKGQLKQMSILLKTRGNPRCRIALVHWHHPSAALEASLQLLEQTRPFMGFIRKKPCPKAGRGLSGTWQGPSHSCPSLPRTCPPQGTPCATTEHLQERFAPFCFPVSLPMRHAGEILFPACPLFLSMSNLLTAVLLL